MKRISKTVLVTGLFLSSTFSVSPVFANDSEPSHKQILQTDQVYQVKYNEEDSVFEFVKEVLKEKVDSSLKTTKKSFYEFETDSKSIKVSGLNVETPGHQLVAITTVDKDASTLAPSQPDNTYGFNLDLSTQVKLIEVDVVDDEAPVIDAKDVYEVEIGSELDLNGLIQVSDNSKDVSVDIEHDVNFYEAGTYPVSVKATDAAGNVSTKSIDVTVQKDFYQRIADAALAQLGVNQDCTALVTNSLKAVGINFHSAPEGYLSLGTLTDNPVPGDIVVYRGHVAIYIGDGQAVHGGWDGYTTRVWSVNCNNPLIGYVHVSR